jgi:hypothetical protein
LPFAGAFEVNKRQLCCFLAVLPLVGVVLATQDHVINEQNNDGAENGDQQTVKIEARDTMSADQAEQKSAYDSANDTEQDVQDQTRAVTINDLAANETRKQTKYEPCNDRHENAFPKSG